MSNLHQKNENESKEENSKEEGFDNEKEEEHNTDGTELEDEEEDIVFDDDAGENVLKKMREKLKACKSERQEYLLGLQRARADYANLNRKIEEEKESAGDKKEEDIMKEIFSVMDSFEAAFKNTDSWESVDKNWKEGVLQIYKSLSSVLENHGVLKIESLDKDFDPNIHEPVDIIPVENKKKDNKIIEVLQEGYKKQDKVLRPAKVKVGQTKNQQS